MKTFFFSTLTLIIILFVYFIYSMTHPSRIQKENEGRDGSTTSTPQSATITPKTSSPQTPPKIDDGSLGTDIHMEFPTVE